MEPRCQYHHGGARRVLRVLCMLTLCSLTSRASTAQRGRSGPSGVSYGTAQRLARPDGSGHAVLRETTLGGRSCAQTDMPQMRLKRFRHRTITCNDGSRAGYYIRRSRGSSKWIVFLEGGWFCFDTASCAERRHMMPDFMSSKKWPRQRKGTGILSSDPQENPHYFHSNIVLIPYCSSDSWSGTRNRTKGDEFAFMGSLIVEEVIQKLMNKGLRKARKLLVAGSSAGGTGVLVNIDQVADLVRSHAPQVDVRGLVDAGWFLDKEPPQGQGCLSAHNCPALISIQRGIQLWEPRLPRDCQARYPTEIWRCYFGHRLYPTLKTPVYIIQNLYDAAQIKVDNILNEQNRGSFDIKWRYLLQLGEQVKATLKNASAVFAPACISHDVLLNSKWHRLSIDGITLSQSIYCWEENGATASSSCQHSHSGGVQNNRLQIGRSSRNDTPLADSPPSRESKKGGKQKHGRKQKRKNRRRKNNQGNLLDADRSRRETEAGSRCKKHLLDRCPWPHCNCSCLRCCWPDTMNEVNQYFMKNLATAMDIDPEKMQNMHLCGY